MQSFGNFKSYAAGLMDLILTPLSPLASIFFVVQHLNEKITRNFKWTSRIKKIHGHKSALSKTMTDLLRELLKEVLTSIEYKH